ncbi:MAG: 6-phosphogluconolactonase, partial [Hyphomonadaceae bacterium]|nr:6-phosphogluconolactonase [Hyphomonadaceae bacterium]
MLQITEFATRDALMQATAERIADTLIQAIAERGHGCAALSGGSTPEPAYRALAEIPMDWDQITFALVDERFVPPSHEASNERMIETALTFAF